jgi:hypothetical protein
MAMTDQEQRALRSYCAFILKEYGFQFSPNDPVIPALFIIHQEMQLNNQNNKAIANLIKEASSKMISKSFHFHSPGEAWKFRMAGAMKWFLTSLLLLIGVAIITWIWSLSDEVERAKDIIEMNGKATELLLQAKKDNQGYFYLDAKEATGNSIQFFSEFERRDSKTVRIYLGREK